MITRNLQARRRHLKNKITVAPIYGSTRPGRFCDRVAGWVAKQISEFAVDIIDPASPPVRTGAEGSDVYDLAWMRQSLSKADAFIVVTPEYHHGHPGALKSFIDAVGAEWHAKPVAFVSYGGISGGLRAVEQLRQVFAELHAVTIRDSVSFASAWDQFDADGTLKNPERARRQMETVVNSLTWWANALRNGRNAIPYPAT